MKMEMEIPPTTTMAVSTSVEQTPSVGNINKMIPANVNTTILHSHDAALPPNFQVCTHGHVCPECHSSLIVKKSPAVANENDTNKDINPSSSNNKHSNIHRLFASTAIDNESINDYTDCHQDTIVTSLKSAHSANLLLTALSFDATTRDTATRQQILELDKVCENVSYCHGCKVHVVTNVDELDRLFTEYNDDNENGSEKEEGGSDKKKKKINDKNSMEWLRGSLLVSVDDAEIFNALEQSSRRITQRDTTAPISLSLNQAGSNLSDVLGTYNNNNATINTDASLITDNQNSILLASSTTQLQKIKHPSEFDYEYRHKVATHVMASKLGKGGYTIVDEICDDCEMPLMMKKKEVGSTPDQGQEGEEKSCKECVVCPKLLKKIAKYSIAHARAAVTNNAEASTPVEQTGKFVHPPLPTATTNNDNDTISAIIAQARCEAPYQENKTRRVVQPDIAEAKQYVMQRQIMGGGMFNNPPSSRKNDHNRNIGTNGSHDTASMTDDHDSTTADADNMLTTTLDDGGGKHHPGIDWDELLINGRAILSKRLNEGWVLSSTNCCGMYCKGTPLLQRAEGSSHFNLDYCAVCGGSGNGEDGAYEREIEWQVRVAEMAERAEREATPDWEELAGNGRALLAERLKQGWTMSSENCCGYHCNDMPLTNIQGGPNSCVVCGGSGTGYDGAYENYKPKEIVEEERALVSQELSRLVGMGWVIRENLCTRCLMPLVAEEEDAEDELCVLCGLLPENNGYVDGGGVCDNIEEEYDEDCRAEDSCMSETIYANNTLKEAVIAPVQTYGDDNTNNAGKRLMMGWTLPDVGTCFHCHGVQMSPPNSTEIGCINRGCPSALAAAYTFLPEPYESTGPVRLIGRGFSTNARKVEEEVDEGEALGRQESSLRVKNRKNNVHNYHHSVNAKHFYHEKDGNYYYDDCPPIMEVGRHNNDDSSYYEEPSVLSDDMTQVRSVASSALGHILVRLDDAKYELEEMRESDADAEECAQKQMEITMLIEKLANAAVQMKQKEDGCN